MTLIAKTGRKSPRVRAILCALYLLLLTGAFSMIYPFLLMISGSTKSAVDANESVVIPGFLTDRDMLYKKYTEGFFNESLLNLRTVFQTNTPSFRQLASPGPINTKLTAAWQDFLKQEPPPFFTYQPSFIYTPVSRETIPHNLRLFKRKLAEEFEGDISQLNNELKTDFANWNSLYIIPRNYLQRRIQPENTPLQRRYNAFKEQLPVTDKYYFSLEGYYRYVFLRAVYPDGISEYNTHHRTAYTTWNEVPLHQTSPTYNGTPAYSNWNIFVREIANPLWVEGTPRATKLYRTYLGAKYKDIVSLNRIYNTTYATFSDIPLYSARQQPYGIALADWGAFISGWTAPGTTNHYQLPAQQIYLYSLENQFREYLNRTLHTPKDLQHRAASWQDIDLPQAQLGYMHFLQHVGAWKREFIVRNYLSVFEYLILHGRALINTVIYCGLSILLALIVNPLAAYALSRYKPPAMYTLLLFLMLTMAFPPMVTQIPVFLMLRQFNLLNTFWALVLPGMANGFSIFLLKGFFDSLPSDLYDSAALDGAGEFTIFWHITMSLSKPILAVIALNAFTISYSNFMMALLICQDHSMWTLMPWLYQLQQRSGSGMIFASLLIAAIPTFVVFSFCQNIIMRGIVIPVEK